MDKSLRFSMLLFRLFKFKYGHATEIREFWGICHENVPVSQQICKKNTKKFGWKQNMLYVCNINVIKMTFSVREKNKNLIIMPMKKKSIIILCSVAAIFAIGLITSFFVDWPVDLNEADGDIAKAARFSREQVSEKLTNMEELLQTDSAFKGGIVAAQVVMQTRAVQFGTLIDMSNEVAGNIPAFAEVLKEMNANSEMVNNVASSLAESAEKLNAALGGEECPDLAQSTINASLAYTTLQKQNNLATRFIDTTDKYLETAQGDDRLKFVRDQWLEYQQMTAALEGDKASAEALAKKGNLLSGEKALAAVANFDIAERLVVLQSCELAQAMKLPNQIGSVIRPKVLDNEISKLCNAQQEVLAHRKIDPHNAQQEVLAHRKIDPHNAQQEVLAHRKIDPHNALVISNASRVMEAFNSALSNVANNPALNQSQNIGLSLVIGNVISQTAAASNSVKLNKKGPKIES